MQGKAAFPGIERIISARYTLAQGITPGVCQIEFAPQSSSIPAAGTLTLQFGEVQLAFPQMRVDQASARRNSRGLVYAVTLLDRRWKWAYGGIFGRYNLRDARGRLVEASEREPRQLAQTLLEAMGETQYDISALPNTARPGVDWQGENPAQELASLAESAGCVVVLKPSGAVTLEIQGAGGALPQLPTLVSAGATLNPADAPDSILVVGGPTLVQARLPLRAVGLETDGTIKPIDDLSYRPASGWARQTPLFSSITDHTHRGLALESVFRWYQVDPRGAGFRDALPPELQADQWQLRWLWQILPLAGELLESHATPEDAAPARRTPRVLGIYWLGNLGQPINSSVHSGYQYRQMFRLRRNLGLVEFVNQVRQWDPMTGQFASASLHLDCAFQILHHQTGAPHRFTWQLPLARNGAPAEVAVRDELRLELLQQRANPESEEYRWRPLRDRHLLEREAGDHAAGAARAYASRQESDAIYAGLVPIAPDGAIREVCWEVGPRGALTWASRNADRIPHQPPYFQRRFFERIRQDLFAAQRFHSAFRGGAP